MLLNGVVVGGSAVLRGVQCECGMRIEGTRAYTTSFACEYVQQAMYGTGMLLRGPSGQTASAWSWRWCGWIRPLEQQPSQATARLLCPHLVAHVGPRPLAQQRPRHLRVAPKAGQVQRRAAVLWPTRNTAAENVDVMILVLSAL